MASELPSAAFRRFPGTLTADISKPFAIRTLARAVAVHPCPGL